MSDPAEGWLEYARHDLQMIELAFDARLQNQVGFHARQRVEKGLLIARGGSSPRSRNLDDLLRLVETDDFQGMDRNIGRLDRYYMLTRYPDALPGLAEHELPNEADAAVAVATARQAPEIATGAAE